MEQQSSSVDNTTEAIKNIKQFIDLVAQNTNDLLTAAAQILASIQETRTNIDEVTESTSALTTNLHRISSSIDLMNQSVKHISENTAHLEEVTQQTETEIHRIDQSFKDVSHNAERTQQLAKETMDAATSGQTSVEASIQGMTELKEVVSNTAQIIQEVNTWGEQVSSILDIVDEITEQTSLLALNASIISAQAGVHGRGFAVVADEIKELATRTKASTKEIGTLVHELQMKTEEGVNNTAEGLRKADQGMQLACAVKDALDIILERATRSSNRASDAAQVIQQTVDSSRKIRIQITSVTEMASKIRMTIQEQEHDVEQVVAAVKNISEMSEQVSRASLEQKRSAEEIERSMEDVTEQFSDISDQTETLRQNSDQIVTAMHTIESTTEQILRNAISISNDTVKNLVQQSNVLQKIVKVFKVS
jgi:methyl-accepting chemotaxis protein